MKRLIVASAVLAMAVVASMAMTRAADDDEDKPKYTIKETMKTCMKGGLCKKVAGGKASDEEEKQLVEHFTSLGKNKPPKGEAESWKKKTGALLKAAQGVAAGDDGAEAALKKAANCGACHKAHKGK